MAIYISKLGNARIFKRKLETSFTNKEKIAAEKLALPFLEYFMLKFFFMILKQYYGPVVSALLSNPKSPRKKRVFLTANFGYATANFGPLSRGKSHSSDINHRVSIILTRGSQKTS